MNGIFSLLDPLENPGNTLGVLCKTWRFEDIFYNYIDVSYFLSFFLSFSSWM